MRKFHCRNLTHGRDAELSTNCTRGRGKFAPNQSKVRLSINSVNVYAKGWDLISYARNIAIQHKNDGERETPLYVVTWSGFYRSIWCIYF